ncbi:thioredoxin-disulfide reductase [Candidatus Marsarchaeota G2 archaeon ECH_B_2]|uniref:Thioredoxin-disulfide reductase n=3 Tax=Candidatus Marsarchaeota group 2 TaxID=2203771 RepID=A0A2R6B726_9ARCH|nr:MAG: thioredoxin-disulfide reductase [Candidatus Marsarchaeota G2 archaeon ECH_B_2]PSN98909.1 MAG: thioredoxin-disulfide reductase [Candidatus Marsarchaeota G2 archaeon ECH_B_3]PSO00991.1 MAG: thioredoxin-disulfide reductase [Candidatus Marsarchaeota G2 archaeon ECH_B_1]
MRNLVIIGSGPAGYTAAIYAARAQLEPLIFTGSSPGGQLMLTSEVENFPGFPDGVLGPDFMDALRRQAEKFGAQIVDEEVVGVDLRVHPFKISTNSRVEEALSVIVATGASAKWLGLPGEQRLRGKGVSGCAVCDGYFFRGRDVVVVGGGDSAMEDALFLTKYASHVTIVHRRREFRASKIMQRRVLTNPKINVIFDSVVEDVVGTNKLEGVVVKNFVTGERTHLAVAGLFVAIGHEPNTKLFRGQLELGEKGYIRVYDQTTRTNVEGVFAAGDVRDPRYRQAVTAAGDGCKAAMDAEKYLESLAEKEGIRLPA